MKVIDLKNIKLASINGKYDYNPKTGKLFLSPEYRKFKKFLIDEIKSNTKLTINPPYYVEIRVKTYLDIDNCIKVILDACEESGVIDNDKHVYGLLVLKEELKKGTKSSLEVHVSELEGMQYYYI